MISEGIFSAAGNAVLVGWLVLLVSVLAPTGSRWFRWLSFAGGRLIPVFLSVVYALLVCLLASRGAEGDLFSLRGIVAKFGNSDHLFLLYLEVLTFSLFIAGWVVEDARRRSAPRWLLLIILPIQFLFGPLGVLAYLAAFKLNAKYRPTVAVQPS